MLNASQFTAYNIDFVKDKGERQNSDMGTLIE